MCQDLGTTWLFGYGSVIWRPGFPFVRKFNGYVKGYRRRFWQRCRYHRGTEEHPGRVVTIVDKDDVDDDDDAEDEEEPIVYGTAFCISNEVSQAVLQQMDFRERGGYVRRSVEVFVDGREAPVCVSYLYVALPDAPDYIRREHGHERSIDDIARVIAGSRGPSGPNVDYLFNLARSLREELQVHDQHVFKLEAAVRKLLREIELQRAAVEPIVGPSMSPCDDVIEIQQKKQLKCREEEEKKQPAIVVIDDGAAQAISCGKARGVLPVGVVRVNGQFDRGTSVLVTDQRGKKICTGKCNYCHKEIETLRGKHSKHIPGLLPRVDSTHLELDSSLCYVVPTERLY